MSIRALLSRRHLYTALLLTIIQCAHAYGDDVITIHKTNTNALELIRAVDEQTSFMFTYSQVQLAAISVEKFDVVNQSLQTVLDLLSKQYNLSFETREKNISIKVKQPAQQKKPAANPGNIRGRIKDATTQEDLPGASIRILQLNSGAISDARGNFHFKNIAQGAYTLEISFLGYTTQQMTVNVLNDQELSVTINLKPAESALEEVVIVAGEDVRYTSIVNSSEQSLLQDIKLSNNIVTGISNAQITRSLDRDASDVMKRVPGVTILNNFVLVRGMDPRYNITYLNNMLVPSTESDSRAFGFNLIPSGLIDDIKIYKAPAPELPGGFGGGLIKVNTRKGQATRHLQLDVSTQYRTNGSSFADYYTGSSDSNRDWIGGGAKDRALPAMFYDPKFKLPNYNFYPEDRVALIRTLPEVNQLQKTHHGLDGRLTLNYYDSYKIGGVRLNNLTAVGYTSQRTNEQRTRAERGIDHWVYNAEGEQLGFIPENQSLDSTSSENIRLSLLENLNLKINDDHSLAFNLFANRNAEDNTVITAESHTGGAAGPQYPIKSGDHAEWRNVGFEYRVRDLISAQLGGQHTFHKIHSLSWNAGRTFQRDYIPDWQTFLFRQGTVPDTYTWELTTLQIDNNTRQRYRTEETVDMGGIDYAITLLPSLTLKAGMLAQHAHREFSNFNYNIAVPTGVSTVRDSYTNVYQPWFHTQSLYADENFKEDQTGLNLISTFSATSYSFDQDIVAGYLAAKLTLLKNKLELYGGMRYEQEYAQLYDATGKKVTEFSTGDKTPGPDFTYYLPSANLTWNINEEHKLRTSFGKTIDRPAYRERSFAQYYSVRDNVTYVGNPLLSNATLDNYDLRWEWYPTENEFISAGVYYKFIDKPIEMYESGYSGSARLNRSWENKRWAELYGLEVEIRKNLGFIPANFLKQFTIIINGSWMHTTVSEVILTGVSSLDARPERPLAGSSPYALNVNLYYEHPKIKTQLTAAYNYIGARIISTAPGFIGNLHEQSQQLLDLVIIQPIGRHIRIKGGVQNILNQDMVRWRDGNYDGEYHPGKFKPASQLIDPEFADQADHEAERWKPGAYYSLGLTFTF